MDIAGLTIIQKWIHYVWIRGEPYRPGCEERILRRGEREVQGTQGCAAERAARGRARPQAAERWIVAGCVRSRVAQGSGRFRCGRQAAPGLSELREVESIP